MQVTKSALFLVLVGALGFATAFYFPDGPPHPRPDRQAGPPPGSATVIPEPRDNDIPKPIPQIIVLPVSRQVQPEPKQVIASYEDEDEDESKPPPKPEIKQRDGITLVPARRMDDVKPEPRQSAGCEMVYSFSASGQSATVQSENYPNDYPNNAKSTLCFSSPSGTSMTVTCDDFNLENHASCAYDYIGLGLSGSPNSVTKYCGTGQQLKSGATSGSNLAFVFKSDVSNPNAGSRPAYRFRCNIAVSSGSATTTTTATPPSGGGGGGAGSAPGNCTCGRRNDGTRIVGGTPAQTNEFPWRCYLKTNRYSFFCGCSVISNTWIMTAAHCTQAVMPLPAGDTLYVVVGDQDRASTSETASQQISVSSVNDHPSYDSNTMDYDMSLLKLSQPLTFSSTISPLCLPWNYANDEFANTTVVASGWGTTTEGGSVSNVLLKVNLPVITTAQCGTFYPGQITDRMICTHLKGKDTCQGDSGGSIDLLRSGRYYGIGVVSWGVGCARDGKPGVYSKTTKFLSWIQSTTNDRSFCKA